MKIRRVEDGEFWVKFKFIDHKGFKRVYKSCGYKEVYENSFKSLFPLAPDGRISLYPIGKEMILSSNSIIKDAETLKWKRVLQANITRLERGNQWAELRPTATHYEIRSGYNTNWAAGVESSLGNALNVLISFGWINVSNSAVDPNDLQSSCRHIYDLSTNSCKLCRADWDILFAKSCCAGGNGGPFQPVYNLGKWHDSNCDSLKPPVGAQLPLTSTGAYHTTPKLDKGICTCGSAKLGSDRHSSWCDIK